MATYQQSVEDVDLLSLRDDIALIDAQLADVLATLGEGGEKWASVQGAYDDLSNALRIADSARAGEAMRRLGAIVEKGASTASAWYLVGELLDRRERLVRSERRRLVELQQTLTMEQALAFTSAVVALVAENVSDRAALAAISNGIRRLVSVGSETA